MSVIRQSSLPFVCHRVNVRYMSAWKYLRILWVERMYDTWRSREWKISSITISVLYNLSVISEIATWPVSILVLLQPFSQLLMITLKQGYTELSTTHTKLVLLDQHIISVIFAYPKNRSLSFVFFSLVVFNFWVWIFPLYDYDYISGIF